MFPTPFKSLAFGMALSVAFAGGALAQQTAPAVVVTNTIDLAYNSGADTPTVTVEAAASVAFAVDRKIDVIVTAQSADGIVEVVPGQLAVVLPFLVQNLGNDTQGYVIDVDDGGNIGASGLVYSATATTTPGQYYVVVSTDTDIANGVAYDLAAAGNAGDLTAGGEFFVLIVANVPTNAIDGQLDDFVVTATATNAGTATVVVEDRTLGLLGVNTVFADEASNSTREPGIEISAALDGADSDETRILLAAPVLLATKTAVVLDEGLPGSTFNCAVGGAATGTPLAAIPGACVEYTISIENTSPSGTAATDISITDALPDSITFAGFTSGDFTVAQSGGTVTATLAALPAGGTQSFTIRATVD